MRTLGNPLRVHAAGTLQIHYGNAANNAAENPEVLSGYSNRRKNCRNTLKGKNQHRSDPSGSPADTTTPIVGVEERKREGERKRGMSSWLHCNYNNLMVLARSQIGFFQHACNNWVFCFLEGLQLLFMFFAEAEWVSESLLQVFCTFRRQVSVLGVSHFCNRSRSQSCWGCPFHSWPYLMVLS